MTPTADEVHKAQERLAGLARTTPLLQSDALNEISGCRLFLKAECLQLTGSFKIRGAGNRLRQLTAAQRKTGVVAFSSGNHAQGVACAAADVGCPAVIVKPHDTPKVKIDGVRRYGAEIVGYDRLTESRENIADELCTQRDAVLVPSYDDPHIVCGQGTAGLEMANQIGDFQETFDHVVICGGGGGLGSGISLVMEETVPSAKLWMAEPEGHDDWVRSLEAGEICSNAPGTRSFCDAILTPQPGDIPFSIAKSRFSGGLVVSDDQIRDAMRLAFLHLKLVLEPGGAVALAAALFAQRPEMEGARIGVTLSGGNVDPDVFADALTGPSAG